MYMPINGDILVLPEQRDRYNAWDYLNGAWVARGPLNEIDCANLLYRHDFVMVIPNPCKFSGFYRKRTK